MEGKKRSKIVNMVDIIVLKEILLKCFNINVIGDFIKML